VCNEIASEFLERYYDYGLDGLLYGYVLDDPHKEMLKNAIALGGPEIAKYIHGILSEFFSYGGPSYEKKIIPHIFQPLENVYSYIRAMKYNIAKEVLNYAKKQLFMLYNYLMNLPEELKKAQ